MAVEKALIGNAIGSASKEHILTTADEIFDEAQGTNQQEINDNVDNRLIALEEMDFSWIAKEGTLTASTESIINKIDTIDIDTTDLAKESTLTASTKTISDKIDSIDIPVIPTDYAKQATLTAATNTITQKLDILTGNTIGVALENTVVSGNTSIYNLLVEKSQEIIDTITTYATSMSVEGKTLVIKTNNINDTTKLI